MYELINHVAKPVITVNEDGSITCTSQHDTMAEACQRSLYMGSKESPIEALRALAIGRLVTANRILRDKVLVDEYAAAGQLSCPYC